MALHAGMKSASALGRAFTVKRGPCQSVRQNPLVLSYSSGFSTSTMALFLHRDAAVFIASKLYDNRIVGHVDNNAVKTAGGQHRRPPLRLITVPPFSFFPSAAV